MKLIKQFLASVWNKSFHNERRFDEIIGHDDTKSIFVKAILSKRPVHLLLVGSPGSAKTMFLTGIMRSIEDSYFIVGSNTTKAGLVSQLFEKKPRFLLIDELEKMNRIDQTSLLHLMETGIISEAKFGKTREMELISWVFATANSCQRIIEPLLSRFIVLEVPEYTLEEFRDIAVSRLATENVEEYIAVTIAEKVWNELESKDIRNVVKVARLTKGFDDVPFIIRMMKKRRKY
jgi:Holliday junction DNA helicase RuvB